MRLHQAHTTTKTSVLNLPVFMESPLTQYVYDASSLDDVLMLCSRPEIFYDKAS